MKKQDTHTSADLKRYLGALHEEHLESLKAIREQFLDVHRQFADVHLQFADVHRKLDEHSAQLTSHTEMIGKLVVDVEIIKSDIGIIKNDLKQKVDRNEFVLLERRVTRLESKVR